MERERKRSQREALSSSLTAVWKKWLSMRLPSPTGNSEPKGKEKDKQGQQLGGREGIERERERVREGKREEREGERCMCQVFLRL